MEMEMGDVTEPKKKEMEALKNPASISVEDLFAAGGGATKFPKTDPLETETPPAADDDREARLAKEVDFAVYLRNKIDKTGKLCSSWVIDPLGFLNDMEGFEPPSREELLASFDERFQGLMKECSGDPVAEKVLKKAAQKMGLLTLDPEEQEDKTPPVKKLTRQEFIAWEFHKYIDKVDVNKYHQDPRLIRLQGLDDAQVTMDDVHTAVDLFLGEPWSSY